MISRKKLAQLVEESRGSAPLPRTLPGPKPPIARAKTVRVRVVKKAALPRTEEKVRFMKPCVVCGAKRGLGELKRTRTVVNGRRATAWQCLVPCVLMPPAKRRAVARAP